MLASTSYQRCARKRMPVGALARALTSLASVPWRNGTTQAYSKPFCVRKVPAAGSDDALAGATASKSVRSRWPDKAKHAREGANDELIHFTGFSGFCISCVFQGRRCNSRSDSPTSSSAVLLA